MTNAYNVLDRLPTLAEYRQLCDACGLSAVLNLEVAELALQRSLHAVVVTYEDTAVAMGRIVGDGATYFYIQDVAVLPEHEEHGVGQLVLRQLMSYLRDHAPDKAFIGIFAPEDAIDAYKRHGFLIHSATTAMFQVLLKGNADTEE